MSNYLAIFREPDGRIVNHSNEDITCHQSKWRMWFEKLGKAGKLRGGSGLTVHGRVIKNYGDSIIDTIHFCGTEIVGGYILLNAKDIEEATEIIKTCPIFEFGGYVELREEQSNNPKNTVL